jgi:hypothetical protein
MTTMLDRIIDGASGDASIDQLLRHLKVLASRTETPALEEWVEHELGGYPDDVDLPAYRGPFSVRPLGNFQGAPMVGSMSNVEIPPSTFPEDLRDGHLFNRSFHEPISTVEQWAKTEHVMFGWSPDSVRMYHYFLQRGQIDPVVQDWFVLVEVRYYVPQTTFTEIMGAVRSKILDLALALERVAPMAGQREAPADQAAPAASVINNHFHAPANVAIGGDTTQLVLDLPAAGDAPGLVRYLAAAGMPTDQLHQLEEHLNSDRDDNSSATDTSTRWTRTRVWLAQAATDTTTGALGGAIAAAAGAFLS